MGVTNSELHSPVRRASNWLGAATLVWTAAALAFLVIFALESYGIRVVGVVALVSLYTGIEGALIVAVLVIWVIAGELVPFAPTPGQLSIVGTYVLYGIVQYALVLGATWTHARRFGDARLVPGGEVASSWSATTVFSSIGLFYCVIFGVAVALILFGLHDTVSSTTAVMDSRPTGPVTIYAHSTLVVSIRFLVLTLWLLFAFFVIMHFLLYLEMVGVRAISDMWAFMIAYVVIGFVSTVAHISGSISYARSDLRHSTRQALCIGLGAIIFTLVWVLTVISLSVWLRNDAPVPCCGSDAWRVRPGTEPAWSRLNSVLASGASSIFAIVLVFVSSAYAHIYPEMKYSP